MNSRLFLCSFNIPFPLSCFGWKFHGQQTCRGPRILIPVVVVGRRKRARAITLAHRFLSPTTGECISSLLSTPFTTILKSFKCVSKNLIFTIRFTKYNVGYCVLGSGWDQSKSMWFVETIGPFNNVISCSTCVNEDVINSCDLRVFKIESFLLIHLKN